MCPQNLHGVTASQRCIQKMATNLLLYALNFTSPHKSFITSNNIPMKPQRLECGISRVYSGAQPLVPSSNFTFVSATQLLRNNFISLLATSMKWEQNISINLNHQHSCHYSVQNNKNINPSKIKHTADG